MKRPMDDKSIGVAVGNLSATERTAFCAACCERLRPPVAAYAAITDDNIITSYTQLLARVWDWLLTKDDNRSWTLDAVVELDVVLRQLDASEPNQYSEMAEDGLAALRFTVQSVRNEDPRLAVWVAMRALEAAETYANDAAGPKEQIQVTINVAVSDQHPAIVRERMAQRASLQALSSAPSHDAITFEALRSSSARQTLGVRPRRRANYADNSVDDDHQLGQLKSAVASLSPEELVKLADSWTSIQATESAVVRSAFIEATRVLGFARVHDLMETANVTNVAPRSPAWQAIAEAAIGVGGRSRLRRGVYASLTRAASAVVGSLPQRATVD
jgi:hypothetical protein